MTADPVEPMTCDAENPYQLLTHLALNGANESDQTATIPMLEALKKKGMKPEEMLADTGYGSGENIVVAAEMGVDLVAPVQDPAGATRPDRWVEPAAAEPASDADSLEHRVEATECPVEAEAIRPSPAVGEVEMATPAGEDPTPSAPAEPPLNLGNFRFNNTFDRMTSCPAGQAPKTNEVRHPEAAAPFKATFGGAQCAGCPLAALCPTRPIASSQDRQIHWGDAAAATAERQREQETADFWDVYKRRSSIEATNAQLKGRPGGGPLRVRGRARVKNALTLKVLGLNVRPAVDYALRRPPSSDGVWKSA